MSREELLKENTELKEKYAALKQQYSQLLKLTHGFKSERLIPTATPEHQTSLFDDQSQEDQPEQEQEQETITYHRKKNKHKGRNKLPEHLPVVEIIIEPEQDTEGLVKIGQEVTETLDYTPASLVKYRTIRPKYAKADGSGIVIGQLPSRPIDKSIAETGLLVYILVSKYVDHLPLHRLAQRFNREFGWNPAQSTLCDWVDRCCQLLRPLYNALKQKILSSDYIQADESPIKVLDRDKVRTTHQGYQWVYHSPLDCLVLFNYRKGRGQQGPKELLENYRGYLQCDGYKVYDAIGQQEGITLVGCLAHARRKFFDAQDNDATRARYALEIIAKIYRLDKQIHKDYQDDYTQIQTQRQQSIAPLLKQIKTWIEQENLKILPQSAIAKAMRYYLRQYPKLEAILLDPRLKLDVSSRVSRSFVILIA